MIPLDFAALPLTECVVVSEVMLSPKEAGEVLPSLGTSPRLHVYLLVCFSCHLPFPPCCVVVGYHI